MLDKVAIVTGAASGVGRAAALRFATEGARVVGVDRNASGGEETVAMARNEGSEVVFLHADTSRSDDIRQVVEGTLTSFGRVDVLVNAAAILMRPPPLAEVEERDWDLTMDTNLKGVFLCCKFAIPAMLKNGGGSIVNISSGAGLRGYGVALPYAVSKAGLIHLTTTAASQYASQGIRVNCIAPGPVDTPQMRGSSGSLEAFRQRESSHPMGRVGRPEEIANVILFLASDEATYINGATYVVDGGERASSH